MNENLKVGSYLFGTEADAGLAKEELERIAYLNKNMNYANISKVMQLYDGALDNKMFRTPIGWDYLNKLRTILLQNGYIEEELRPIPLSSVFARNENREPLAPQIRTRKNKKEPYKNRFIIASIICGVLLLTVISMFGIAMTSETPNMINYRNAIINEYASWEQDIKNREDEVRAKERELGMVSKLPHDEIGDVEAE